MNIFIPIIKYPSDDNIFEHEECSGEGLKMLQGVFDFAEKHNIPINFHSCDEKDLDK